MKGITENTNYILNRDSPVYKLKGTKLEDSGTKLVRGTVTEGTVTSLMIQHPQDKKEKVAVRMVEIKGGKKEYLPMEVLDIFIDNFSGSNGLLAAEKIMDSKTNPKKTPAILYIIPVAAGIAGYYIARKKMFGKTGTILTVLAMAAAGMLPYWYSKTKNKPK